MERIETDESGRLFCLIHNQPRMSCGFWPGKPHDYIETTNGEGKTKPEKPTLFLKPQEQLVLSHIEAFVKTNRNEPDLAKGLMSLFLEIVPKIEGLTQNTDKKP